MKLLLCRDGQTDHNRNGIIQGQMNASLNKKGLKQAEKLAKRLREENIDFIYSSSMDRAEETAEIISEKTGLDVNKTDHLKEIDRARFEGEPSESLMEEVAGANVEDYLWSPKNGESWKEVKDRCMKFFQRIKKKHEGEKVAVVAHGGSISVSIMGILKHSAKNCYRIHQDNCCVNELEWSKKREWEISSINDTCHLQ